MDENQQPSLTEELGRLFPSLRGGGRRGVSLLGLMQWTVSLLGLVLVNHLLQQLIQIILVLQHGRLKKCTTKRTIEKVWGSKATSKKPQKSMSHKATSGKFPSKFSILSSVKASDFRFVKFSSSQVWSHFSSLIFHDCSLRFSKQKVSYFKPFQSCPKGILRLWTRAFEANVPKKPCAKLCFRKRSGQ